MHARLTLSTQRRGPQTVLHRSEIRPPFKLLTLPPQADGLLRAIQMSSSPGLLAGDTVDIELNLAAGSALSLHTQAFTRVLSMDEGGCARQHTRINQQTGSRLCYLPHPLVLHRGSSLLQRTEIRLADACELVYGDITTAGRVLCGEQFAFRRFSSHLFVFHADTLLLHDNIQWQPERHPPAALGQMEAYTHQLNLFYLHTDRTAADIRNLSDALYAHLHGTNTATSVLWGVSQAQAHALCLRALGHSAQSLQRLLHQAAAFLQPQHAAASPVFMY